MSKITPVFTGGADGSRTRLVCTEHKTHISKWFHKMMDGERYIVLQLRG